jgi:hypothetical protein
MPFSSNALIGVGTDWGTPARLTAVGLAEALCKRFHFVTPPGIVSRAFRIPCCGGT